MQQTTQTTTIQDVRKKKLLKSYDELLAEVKNLFKKSAAVYVPELCEALAVEHLDWSNKEIEETVYSDLDGFWSSETVRNSLPSWIHNPGAVARAKKAWETKNANKLKSVNKMFTEVQKVELPSPPEPKQATYEGEDLDLESGRLATYGEKGKTISQMKGSITYNCAKLFTALTERDHMPHNHEDLELDYIKPTRQFRKSLVLELDEQSKKTLWNYLGAVDTAIQDMLELLEPEMKKS